MDLVPLTSSAGQDARAAGAVVDGLLIGSMPLGHIVLILN